MGKVIHFILSVLCVAAVPAVIYAGYYFGGGVGVCIALLFLLLLFILIGTGFYIFVLKRPKDVLLFGDHYTGLSKAEARETFDQAVARDRQTLEPYGIEDVEITSRSGLRLHGVFVQGKPGETRTAIICHGYGGIGMQVSIFAVYLRQKYGFNILMPDARGHGESESKYVGLGWPERLDILDWIHYLIRKIGPEAQILVEGSSMGGATVANLSGEELPGQVKFLMEDCGFTSLSALCRYVLSERMHLPTTPILIPGLLMAYCFTGEKFWQHKPIHQVTKTKVPMIFIHGEADVMVPTRMAKELFDASASPKKELVLVPLAGHALSFQQKDGKFQDVLDRYITAYMKE